MPILADNLKLYRAAVHDSANPLNGGLPSAVEIIDGASNQIFEDISETQRAGGAIEFAKVYPAVRTADTDVLRGGNIIICDPPDNAATSVVLFAAASVGETQADVIERIGGVSGAITADDRSKLSDEVYVSEPWHEAGTVWRGSGGGVVGAGGMWKLQLTSTLYAIAETAFVPGDPISFIEFYKDRILKAETRVILRTYKEHRSVLLSATVVVQYYDLWVEFEEASDYANWGAATRTVLEAEAANQPLYGAYVTGAQSLGSQGFSYFGASRLTAAAAAGSDVMTVAAVTAPVVPVALIDSPEAETIIGFQPRLLSRAPDGREPIFEVGRYVVVGKDVTSGPSLFTAGPVDLGETILKRIKIVGADGQRITAGWTANLDTGIVTISSVSGWSQPATIIARCEDMALITAIDGLAISIGKDLLHSYPIGFSVSAALVFGDLRARLVNIFDQVTWTGVWSSDVIGSVAGGQYNSALYPIELTNSGTITESWRIQFTSSTAFIVAGKSVGQIYSGDVTTDCSPINPASGLPYFTLKASGWGAGWANGNIVRIDTVGATPPTWLLRCIQASPETLDADSFELAFRGGVNRP